MTARAAVAAMSVYTLELREAEIKLNQNESPFDFPFKDEALISRVSARDVEDMLALFFAHDFGTAEGIGCGALGHASGFGYIPELDGLVGTSRQKQASWFRARLAHLLYRFKLALTRRFGGV